MPDHLATISGAMLVLTVLNGIFVAATICTNSSYRSKDETLEEELPCMIVEVAIAV